ncbi:MAG: replication-relaxation family protein [Polyangiaceae bacterium]
MRLAATEAFFAPPELRRLAETVFRALATVRFARRTSLLAVFGPEGLTPDLVDGWVQAGLVHEARVLPVALASETVPYLALTSAGARALTMATGVLASGLSAARMKRSSQKRAHDLAVGEFGLTVTALARAQEIDLLGVQFDDKRLATSIVLRVPGQGPKRVALQADGYVLVRGPRGPVGLLVEVDRGTTSPLRLAEKYHGYLAWKTEGGPERDFAVRAMRVVTLVPDERRLEKLHAAALIANLDKRSGFLLFACDADVRPTECLRLLAPIARSLGGDDAMRVPLFPSCSGAKVPQAAAPSGGSPLGCLEASQCLPGGLSLPHARPPAVAAPPRVPML